MILYDLKLIYKIALEYQGERDPLTRKYLLCLSKLNNPQSFSLESNSNTLNTNTNKTTKNDENLDFNLVAHKILDDSIFQSFCSKIINKALQSKNKNRHNHNHDSRKIYIESEQNLKKMKFIVDTFSMPNRKDQPLKKINILYSPNHSKIYETQTQRENENINLTFYKEKRPSIFTLLTQKTPYSKRIPLIKPFSAKNSNMSSANFWSQIEELKFN